MIKISLVKRAQGLLKFLDIELTSETKLNSGIKGVQSKLAKALLMGFVGVIGLGGTKSFAQSTLPYLDTDFACTDDAKIQQFKSDFNIDIRSFGGPEKCDSKIDSKKLFNDLQLISEGRFQADTKDSFLIQGFVPSGDYYGYTKSETRGIRRGMDIPMATAYNRGGYFTMQDGWSRLSTLGRVGVFVHEARHTEGYVHVQCRQGSYAGSQVMGCDSKFSEGGSHAVEMEYYARVALLGQNFHPVYKTLARLMAMARANFVFNQPILTRKESLLAQDGKSGQIYLLDNQKLYPRETPNKTGRLKRTSFGGVVFTGAEAFAVEMYERSGFSPTIEDTFSYFKILKSFDVGTSWSDMEEFDKGVNRYLVRIKNNKEIAGYNFPGGRWDSFKTLPAEMDTTSTALENGEAGYFVITKQNEIYEVDPSNNLMASKKSFAWNRDYKRITKLNDKTLILKNDGRIYENTSSGLVPYTDGSTQFSDMTSVPLYNAFEVKL